MSAATKTDTTATDDATAATATDAPIDPKDDDKPKRKGGWPKGRPRKQAPAASDRPPSSRSRAGQPKSLKQPLTDVIIGVGIVVGLANAADGVAVCNGADDLADALNKAAKESPRLHRNLTRMVTTTVWGAVALATLKIVRPIMQNHGLLPATPPGLDLDRLAELQTRALAGDADAQAELFALARDAGLVADDNGPAAATA